MTMQLRLNYWRPGIDEVTVNLNVDGCKLLDGYAPTSPTSEKQTTLTEDVTLFLMGTGAAIREKLADIQRALNLAIENRPLTPVMVRFDVDGSGTAYQSKLHGGSLQLTSKLINSWARGRAKAVLTFERDAVWEALTWVDVPISNTNGANVTDGSLKIYNCADTSGSAPNQRINYIDIAAADVSGSLPAPVRLLLTPSATVTHVYVGHQANLDNTGLLLNRQEMESLTGSGSVSADAGCSGGNYRALTIAAGTTETLSHPSDWDMRYFSGGWYKFFMRYQAAPPANVKTRIGLGLNAGAIGSYTPWAFLSTGLLQELGDMRIPDREYLGGRSVFTLTKNYVLSVESKNTGMISAALNPDVLYYLPTDSYVAFGSSLNPVASGYRIDYRNGLEKFLASFDISDNKYSAYFDVLDGMGIWLRPGVTQRLHFLWRNATACSITDTMMVMLQYKPRRYTI
jgi:hypothetical protein